MEGLDFFPVCFGWIGSGRVLVAWFLKALGMVGGLEDVNLIALVYSAGFDCIFISNMRVSN